MINKEELLQKISIALDSIPDIENTTLYASLQFSDYTPSHKYEEKYSYRRYEVSYEDGIKDFIVRDESEIYNHRCEMNYSDCNKRGHCNGDC